MDIKNEPGEYSLTFESDVTINDKYDTISDFIISGILKEKRQSIYKIDCFMIDEESREDFILNSLNPLFRKYLKNKTIRENSDGISHIGTTQIILCERICIDFYIFKKAMTNSNADLIIFFNSNNTNESIINNLKENQIAYIIN